MGSALADTAVSNGLLRPILHWPQRSYLTYLASELFICTFSYGLLVAIRQAMNAYRVAAERRLRASELETELARAHLRALQMQLRPHFLFNALHTVAALVRAGESRTAVRTLSELGEFLRWVLEQDDAQLVPLRRELDLLDRYLRIEQIRFQDRLITQVDVEPRALEALVPTLILQPLVENAVHHGLPAPLRPGRIDVTVHVDVPMLCIEVRDSGAGPSPIGTPGHRAGEHPRAAGASLRERPPLRAPSLRGGRRGGRSCASPTDRRRAHERHPAPRPGGGRRAAGPAHPLRAAGPASATSSWSASAATVAARRRPSAPAARTSCSSTCRCRSWTASASSARVRDVRVPGGGLRHRLRPARGARVRRGGARTTW